MMTLHGGRLSPFVRRAELWLSLQERAFERQFVSVFDADFGGLLPINPLGRVPVLTLEDGTHLFETSAIVDYLEDTAASGRRLIVQSGPQRWRQLQDIALAHGIAEKAVALVYESERRPAHLQWSDWQQRLSTQIRNGLDALDDRVGSAATPVDGTGISAVCAYDMVVLKFPGLLGEVGNLEQLSKAANAHPAFARTHPSLA